MKQDKLNLLKQKVKYFFDNNISVHITFKDSKSWKNGNIIEPKASDFFMLEEFKEGLVPIFYLQISDIIKFGKEEKEDEM